MFFEWVAMSMTAVLLCLTLGLFVFPLKAGNKQPSRTLTGMYLSMVWIFFSTAMDSANDRATPTAAIPGRVVAQTTTRPVSKEKYGVLFGMFLTFSILYLVSHRQKEMSEWVIKGIMALMKMNPYGHENEIDDAAIRVLEATNDREWFLRFVLASKHGKQVESSEPPTEPAAHDGHGDH